MNPEQQILLKQLRTLLNADAVLSAAEAAQRSVGIWDERPVEALALIRPASTAELSAVMRLCHAAKQSVVTHGGRTGLVEGCVSSANDIVVSLECMNQIESVDLAGRYMVVQAGAPLEAAQDAAEALGLMLPLDLGARGSCTIGGNISTNAGGNRVLRYGMTRDIVLGLEAVLADGSVISSMNRMLKNNAGYDLKQLFIGTEGTLGIVTRAVMRLRPAPGSESTALVACDSFSQVEQLLVYLERELGGHLSAFECMWRGFYKCVSKQFQAPLSGSSAYYVLVEALGAEPIADAERFLEILTAATDAGFLDDAVIAKSGTESDELWKLRDSVELCLQFGPSFIFDVSLPLSDMSRYVDEVMALLDERCPDHHTFVFGHVGDGNLHFVISPGSSDLQNAVEESVYRPLQHYGGSVSAEHGIGLEKKRWLHLSRTESEIDLMRQLKNALDPMALLNPDKVIGGFG